MKKILVVTDLHIRSEGQTIIGIDTYARFKECLAHATKYNADADHIVFLGDLTHSGKVAEYELLAEALKEVKIPYTLACGNHDNRDNLRSVFPNSPKTEDGFFQASVDLDDLQLVILDSLDGPPFCNDHHSGLLCESRLNWMRQALKKGRALVFMHHPPHKVGFKGMDAIRLQNGDAVLAELAEHPNVAHLFCGHIHRTISGNAQGVPFTIFKSPSHQMPFDLTNETCVISTPEPGAYGIILADSDNVIVHSEDFQLAIPDVQPNDDALPE